MDTQTPADDDLYDELSDDLYALETVVTASELHGMICGALAANDVLHGLAWRDKCLAFLSLPGEPQHQAALDRVLALPDQVAPAMAQQDYSFQLLLPPDDCEQSLRTEELGNWCQAFLEGLALAGQNQQRWSAFPEQLAEGLTDLATIAQIEASEDDSEVDFMQLFEYVRMVVLNTYAELRSDSPSNTADAPGVGGLFSSDHKLH